MTQKASHRVAKRMILRLEQREKIQIDHTKFARLTLDRSLSQRLVWTMAGGPRIHVEERYSINFWRAMNTPSEALKFVLVVKCFDGDEIQQSKALARSGREVARRLSREGLRIRHESEIGETPHHTVNVFHFDILAHHSTYKVLIQPYLKSILKPFISVAASRDIQLSVTHPQLDDYARFVLKSEPRLEPSQPSPYF